MTVKAKCVRCFAEPVARFFEFEISRTASLKGSVEQALPERCCQGALANASDQRHEYDVLVTFEEVD